MTARTRPLDMTVVNRYANGSPIYKFSTSFPSRGVRMAGPLQGFATPEEAIDYGFQEVKNYQAADVYGNMGEVCGYTEITVIGLGQRFRPVINTFHSNT